MGDAQPAAAEVIDLRDRQRGSLRRKAARPVDSVRPTR
jgi:hypothetical protein